MKAVPILICYFPVGDLDDEMISKYCEGVLEGLQKVAVGWQCLIIPSRERTEMTFATATAHRLKPLQQEQLDNLKADMDRFFKKAVG